MNIHIITFKNLSNFGIIDMQWLDQIAINYFLGIETIKLVENTNNQACLTGNPGKPGEINGLTRNFPRSKFRGKRFTLTSFFFPSHFFTRVNKRSFLEFSSIQVLTILYYNIVFKCLITILNF